MWVSAVRHLARTLGVVALVFQALMPGAMAAASARPGDVPAVLCALPGDGAHGAARTVGAELAQLIVEKTKPSPAGDGHDCPACVLAFAATLPGPVILKTPLIGREHVSAPVFEIRFAHGPRGPPVGARAPPVFMKA